MGVSRSTGNGWTRGYNVIRNGVVVKFVPPLDRLAIREISPRFLPQDERIELADLRRTGMGIRSIARQLGRAPSTISRELRRHASGKRRGYTPLDAHRQRSCGAAARTVGALPPTRRSAT